MEIEGRTHPVAIHFSRKTNPDYMAEAYKKVVKIHTRLPNGGILVFVTGQTEVMSLCTKLRRRFAEKRPLVEAKIMTSADATLTRGENEDTAPLDFDGSFAIIILNVFTC